MKRLLSGVLSAAMIVSGAALPAGAADKKSETISYTYSAGDGSTYEREMEKLGRGLVAVNTDSGVFLSWRLFDNEDAILGSAKNGVSFKVYRDGAEIATVTNSTNYTDQTAGTSYSVAPVVNGVTGEKCAAVSVMQNNYFDIPLVTPETETVDYKYTDSETNELVDGTLTYNFSPADCSTGDLDGDGEYEIIVKWTSAEKDVGSPGSPAYSGTVRFAAYKLNGKKMWSQDINLGKNVYSSAHTAQFLVYDFDGDGKSEMMVQTSRGSKDALGNYVSKAADPETYPNIASLTDEDNANADYRNAGWGLITTGDEYLTVFNGETGAAMDTIDLPTPRGNSLEWGDPKETSGNRVNRFMASVAYLDGERPYAVYSRGYYFAKEEAAVNADRQRTSIAGISFENGRLNPKYRFDTNINYPGSYEGSQKYAGNGNHNCTVADVDGDGKDEYITGALCMEVDDEDRFRPRWCTFMEHGDALHIGDYDPTHKGFEFFTVHEDGGPNHYTGTEIGFGMSAIDADTGEILFHEGADKDTGRGVMANIGMGGYYQIWSSNNANLYMSNGGKSFASGSKSGLSQNFRIFWDGDLYDELLDGTNITSWNGNGMSTIFNAANYGCVKINGTKANPALQADLFGDWREEVVYPLSDGSALRVFTTTTPTNYKMKTLMQDPVYRSGVAAEQTAYNQPPHVGIYMADETFTPDAKSIEIASLPLKTEYYQGESLNTTGLSVKVTYTDDSVEFTDGYQLSGYNANTPGRQTITVAYKDKTATFDVNVLPLDISNIDGTYVTDSTSSVSQNIQIGSLTGDFAIEHTLTINSMPANGNTDRNSTAGFMVKFTPSNGAVGAGWYITNSNNKAKISWKSMTSTDIAILEIGVPYIFRYTFTDVGNNKGAHVNLVITDLNGNLIGNGSELELRNMTSNNSKPITLTYPLTSVNIYNQANAGSQSSVTIANAHLGNIINVDTENRNATVYIPSADIKLYAAKYDNTSLTNIQQLTVDEENYGKATSVDLDFVPDKIFCWKNMKPIELWENK